MLTEEEIKIINKRISRGEPEGEIRNELLLAGHSQADIDELFKPKPYDMRSWLLFFGIVITLFGLYLLMQQGSLLILILGSLLLWQYYKLQLEHRSEQKDNT